MAASAPPISRANLFWNDPVMRARSGALQGSILVSRDPSDYPACRDEERERNKERKTRRWQRRREMEATTAAAAIATLSFSLSLSRGITSRSRGAKSCIRERSALRFRRPQASHRAIAGDGRNRKRRDRERARRERAEAERPSEAKPPPAAFPPSTRASRVSGAAALASRSLLRSPASLPRAAGTSRLACTGEKGSRAPYLACAFPLFGKERKSKRKRREKSETQ